MNLFFLSPGHATIHENPHQVTALANTLTKTSSLKNCEK